MNARAQVDPSVMTPLWERVVTWGALGASGASCASPRRGISGQIAMPAAKSSAQIPPSASSVLSRKTEFLGSPAPGKPHGR
jgi:hypothetical protein